MCREVTKANPVLPRGSQSGWGGQHGKRQFAKKRAKCLLFLLRNMGSWGRDPELSLGGREGSLGEKVS